MCPSETTRLNNVAAYMPSQNWAQAYARQASCISDTDDIAGSSIFGGGMGLGGGVPFMGMGYGWGPGSEIMNMSMDDYYRYQSDLNGKQMDYQLANKRKAELTGLKATVAEDVVTRRVASLQRAVENNEQDYVYNEYNKLKKAVKQKLIEDGYKEDEINNQQLKAITDSLYAKANGGVGLVEELEAKGDSTFVQGLKQGAFFGLGAEFTNKKNYKDNLQRITGEEVTSEDKTWKTVGQVTSAIVTGALAIFALPWLLKGGLKGIRGASGSFIKGWKSLLGIGKNVAEKA